MAPNWEPADLERVVREAIPEATTYRASSRDPATIAALNPRLLAAGYSSETRVAMVQTFIATSPSPLAGERRGQSPSPLAGEGRGGGYSILPVHTERQWHSLEALIRADTREHSWTEPMTSQLIALYRWRAANTPHHYYLADDGRQTVGHVGLFQHRATAYLHGLFTHPSARRRGAGAALTLAMSVEAGALGCERLVLQCPRDSHLPVFYERLGYRVVGEQQIWTKGQW